MRKLSQKYMSVLFHCRSLPVISWISVSAVSVLFYCTLLVCLLKTLMASTLSMHIGDQLDSDQEVSSQMCHSLAKPCGSKFGFRIEKYRSSILFGTKNYKIIDD
jgi:hypothetical protein